MGADKFNRPHSILPEALSSFSFRLAYPVLNFSTRADFGRRCYLLTVEMRHFPLFVEFAKVLNT